jgi:hypothetical protein
LFNSGWSTALHNASVGGHLEVVKALVAAKADLTAKGRYFAAASASHESALAPFASHSSIQLRTNAFEECHRRLPFW